MSVGEARLRELLELAVRDFARNRRAPFYIRWFAERAPEILISVGIEMLLNGPDTPGFRYLCIQMLKQPSFFRELTDPWKYTVPQAVKLAGSLFAVDPTLDIKLARSLPGRTGPSEDGLEGERAERALQILDEISVGRRIVPVLNHLANHNDIRISSKSTLLVGKRVQSMAWAKRMLEEGRDPRIRANAIEAFWGVSTKPALQLFRGSLNDEHNRVVGNSMMGLHLAGDDEVPRIVNKSAEDCNAAFRMTASWVMGKIGDPVYVERLHSLVRDADPRVRSAALRSLMEIRQEEKWRAQRDAQKSELGKEVAKELEAVAAAGAGAEDKVWWGGGQVWRGRG